MTTPVLTAQLGRATLSNSGWYRGQLITFLAVGSDTEDQFALLRVHGIQGAEPLPHYHVGENETLYLLEGELTLFVGGEEHHACPSDIVIIPRGVVHTIRYDTREVKFLLEFSPAGFERFFHELSEPAEFLGLPLHPTPLDQARLVETAAQYGCVFPRLEPYIAVNRSRDG